MKRHEGLNARDVKCEVYLQGVRQLEAHCHRVNNLGYGKGSHKARC